ncbi:MAG: 1,3-beta-glucanosyltransferase gas1 [Bogoriella megaspora]|nr:MAG: 1,3-beta-glucanosyltransferase gas1 [Bogoriella megaspora]
MRGFGITSTIVAAAGLFASSALAQGGSVDPLVIKVSFRRHVSTFGNTHLSIPGREILLQNQWHAINAGGNGSVSEGAGNTYTDPLADPVACARDVPLLSQLLTNTIRVYAVDPTKDHSECMRLLADAGIYVISDLSSPSESIQSNNPSWDDALYARYTSVVDALQNYTNVIGFFAGNEVSNQPNNTAAAAFVKAAVRDIKGYISAKGYRELAVGYASADVSEIREQLANYLDCDSESNAIDFWGYNIYSWCGKSDYKTSGYQARTQEFSSYGAPVFFAEYGCNTDLQASDGVRTFDEVDALYGDDMSKVFSGGIVYMYFQEENNFGLVSIDEHQSASTMPDFSNLQSQLAKATPSSVSMNAYNPSNSLQACPTTDDNWLAAVSPLPPSPNQELCGCMQSSLSCVVNSDVSQDDYADLFSYICAQDKGACAGINTNTSQYDGKFGSYGMCNATERLNFALNQYAAAQSNNPSACDFSGSATQQQAQQTPSGGCGALLSQAGSAGTGTVTSSPTSGGGGGGSAAATSSGAASGMVTVPRLDVGLLQLGVYVAFAAFSGAAMIML